MFRVVQNLFPERKEQITNFENEIMTKVFDEYQDKIIILQKKREDLLIEFKGSEQGNKYKRLQNSFNRAFTLAVPLTITILALYVEYGNLSILKKLDTSKVILLVSVIVTLFVFMYTTYTSALRRKIDSQERKSAIKESKFKNVSADLIFSVLNQNIESVKNSLEILIKYEIPHISTYSLTLEKGTKLYEYYKFNNINQDEIIDRKMYYMIRGILKKYNYHQYEISNFSKKGYESRHNLVYWNKEDYIGIGLNASSYYNNSRIKNYDGFDKYFESVDKYCNSIENIKEIERDEDEYEYIILKLRTNKGIIIDEINRIYDIDFLTKYEKQIEKLRNYNLILLDYDKSNKYIKKISLTYKGMDLSNFVFSEF